MKQAPFTLRTKKCSFYLDAVIGCQYVVMLLKPILTPCYIDDGHPFSQQLITFYVGAVTVYIQGAGTHLWQVITAV